MKHKNCCDPHDNDLQAKCSYCGKSCDLKTTVFKIKHKDEIYCFDTDACRHKFQMKHFGQILY